MIWAKLANLCMKSDEYGLGDYVGEATALSSSRLKSIRTE